MTATDTAPSGPSLFDSALVVWGTIEAAFRAYHLRFSVESGLAPDVASALSWSMWRDTLEEFTVTLGMFDFWTSVIVVGTLLPAFLPFWVSLPALWRRRRQASALGAFAVCFLPDAVVLLQPEPSRVLWHALLVLGGLGGAFLVWVARAGVPSSSWFFITLLVPSILVQRWFPVVLTVVWVQLALALWFGRQRQGRVGAGASRETTA